MFVVYAFQKDMKKFDVWKFLLQVLILKMEENLHIE